MASAAGSVLVIGGTRRTGLLIAERLSRQGRPVRVMARDPEAAKRRLEPEIEIVPGDLTKPESLGMAVAGVTAVILTAGCRSGRFATERKIKATEFEGVRSLLGVLQRQGFQGRLLYMTSSGVGSRSLASWALNLYKGNTLRWRYRAEAEIRSSAMDYTIIRAGVLMNRPGGQRGLRVTQKPLPLSPRYRIARADVAEVFIAALDSPKLSRASFEVVWDSGREKQPMDELFDTIQSDVELGI